MTPGTTHVPIDTALCTNCEAPLTGPFCNECGQQALAQPYSLRAFLATSVSDVFNLRSRTLRSLIHLFIKPGEVTASYFEGHRVRYTQPVQLYLIAAAMFFLANSLNPFVTITEENVVMSGLGAVRAGTELSETELAGLEQAGMLLPVFRERFRSAVSQSLPPFMTLSIAGFALVLMLFTRRRPPLMHIIFSLHWTGFYLALMSFERLVPGMEGGTSILAPIFSVLALIHLAIALRRVYGHGWLRATASSVALIILFNMLIAAWVMSVISVAYRMAT